MRSDLTSGRSLLLLACARYDTSVRHAALRPVRRCFFIEGSQRRAALPRMLGSDSAILKAELVAKQRS